MTFQLDGIDITEAIEKQLGSSTDSWGEVVPSENNKWIDLIALINSNSELAKKFSDSPGLHTLKITTDNTETEVKMLSKATYSTRNA